MKKQLFILTIITILMLSIGSQLVFMAAQYLTSVSLGYKATVVQDFIYSDLIDMARERSQLQYEGKPLPNAPHFERDFLLFRLSGVLAVIMVGFAGCMIIWYSDVKSKRLVPPLKWVWISMVVMLTRTPIVVAIWLFKEWRGKPFCRPIDPMVIGDLGLHPYIYAPIISIVLLTCLGTALYKVVK